METRLTIFLALVFLVMAWNAVLLWVLRRMLHRANAHLDRNRLRYTHLGDTLRMSIRVAERTTEDLAGMTAELRSTVHEWEETLDRADNWARYGLAKMDFNADRASQKLHRGTRTLAGRVGEQLFRTATVIHGIKAALEFIARLKGDRTRHPVRTLLRPAPLDAALAAFQAMTALGKLFSSRAEREQAESDAAG